MPIGKPRGKSARNASSISESSQFTCYITALLIRKYVMKLQVTGNERRSARTRGDVKQEYSSANDFNSLYFGALLQC